MEEELKREEAPEKVENEDYTPISPLAYVGYNILFSIPVVGLVFIILWSISSEKVNLRNYARAQLICIAIGVCIGLIVFFGFLGGTMSNVQSLRT